MDRTITAAPLSTPHDVVVSQLLGRRASTSQESLVTPDPARHTLPKISIDGTASSLYHSDETPPPSQARSGLRSASASPLSAQPEHVPIYDPFTGALAGVMTPPVHDPEGGQAMSDTDFDQTRDELWVHLARIRELQSEIAGMHLQMEGVGSSDARSARRAAGATRRATEEWDDPGEAEERSKAMRDAEFATLAETFRGRRVAIDGIMNKVSTNCAPVTDVTQGRPFRHSSTICLKPSPLFTHCLRLSWNFPTAAAILRILGRGMVRATCRCQLQILLKGLL